MQLANATTADLTTIASLMEQVQHLYEENTKLYEKLAVVLEKLAVACTDTKPKRKC